MLFNFMGAIGDTRKKERSDLVFIETKKGDAVSSVSSMAYSGALPWTGLDYNISSMRLKLLSRLMGPASRALTAA